MMQYNPKINENGEEFERCEDGDVDRKVFEKSAFAML
jgi:hypothetical protein